MYVIIRKVGGEDRFFNGFQYGDSLGLASNDGEIPLFTSNQAKILQTYVETAQEFIRIHKSDNNIGPLFIKGLNLLELDDFK